MISFACPFVFGCLFIYKIRIYDNTAQRTISLWLLLNIRSRIYFLFVWFDLLEYHAIVSPFFPFWSGNKLKSDCLANLSPFYYSDTPATVYMYNTRTQKHHIFYGIQTHTEEHKTHGLYLNFLHSYCVSVSVYVVIGTQRWTQTQTFD